MREKFFMQFIYVIYPVLRLFQGFNYPFVRIKQETGEYRIRVYRSGQLLKAIGIENLNDIKKLTIKGPVNDIDVLLIKKMINLEELNLKYALLYYRKKRHFFDRSNLGQLGRGFFEGNIRLRKVVLAKNTPYIPDYAFANCSQLESVFLPESLKYIGEKAFYKTKVKKIYVPKSVKVIASGAFEECINLMCLIFADGRSFIKWKESSFHRCPVEKVYLGRPTKYSDYCELNDTSCLREIILGKYVRKVYMHFGNMVELIVCHGKIPPVLRNYFTGKCSLMVPEKYYTLYWVHPQWGKMKIQTF